MLLCKACNTRFEDGRSACPSCGRRIFTSVKGDAPKSGEPDLLPLPPGSSGEIPNPAVDLELGEVDVLAEAVEPEVADELKPEPPPRPKPRARALDPEPGPAVFHLSAAQVRTLVAEQPALLEPDLTIYKDVKKNVVGVDFRTPVGSIDLLARDGEGGFVVVMVPDPRDLDSLIAEMLARIGYVRKHLAAERKPVHGIVVIEESPEELAYAAAGVSQTISFKAFRVALTFHPLPL